MFRIIEPGCYRGPTGVAGDHRGKQGLSTAKALKVAPKRQVSGIRARRQCAAGRVCPWRAMVSHGLERLKDRFRHVLEVDRRLLVRRAAAARRLCLHASEGSLVRWKVLAENVRGCV